MPNYSFCARGCLAGESVCGSDPGGAGVVPPGARRGHAAAPSASGSHGTTAFPQIQREALATLGAAGARSSNAGLSHKQAEAFFSN